MHSFVGENFQLFKITLIQNPSFFFNLRKLKNFKYLASLLTNETFIRVEMKCGQSELGIFDQEIHLLFSPNAFVFSKNLKIKIYKIIILTVVLYGFIIFRFLERSREKTIFVDSIIA